MEGVSGLHVACGLLVGLVLPLTARIAGSETFAYNMFSGMTTYSIEVVAIDTAGVRSRISPSSLSPSLSSAARRFVSGAEQPRRARTVAVLRAHLIDLARVACEGTGARTIDLALTERADDQRPEAPSRRTEAHVACP
jgi:hypothetical protein